MAWISSQLTYPWSTTNPTPFDPRRVPPSGGMASRLLAGIIVSHARSELDSLFN